MESETEQLNKSLDLLAKLGMLLLASSAALLLLSASPSRRPQLERAREVVQRIPVIHNDSLSIATFVRLDRAYHDLIREIGDSLQMVLEPFSPSGINDGPEISGSSEYITDLILPGADASLDDEISFLRSIRTHLYAQPNPDNLSKRLRNGIPPSCGNCQVLLQAELDTISDSTRYAWEFVRVESAAGDTMSFGEFAGRVEFTVTEEDYEVTSRSQDIISDFMIATFPAHDFGPRLAPWWLGPVVIPPSPDTIASILRAWESLIEEWPEFAHDYAMLPRQQIIARLQGEIAQENRTLSLLGMTLDEGIAAVGGPLVIGLLMLYQIIILRHIRGRWRGHPLLAMYPWPPNFPGPAGLLSHLVVAGIPVLALGIFSARLVVNNGISDVPRTWSQILQFGLTATCVSMSIMIIAFTRSIHDPRRIAPAEEMDSERGVTREDV